MPPPILVWRHLNEQHKAMNQRDLFIDWIEDITHWTTKMDMTFKWNCTQMNARRLYCNWMRKHLPGSTFMYSIEEDPNQGKVAKSGQGLNKACHIHAISDTKWDIVLAKTGRLRKDLWQDWKSQFGRNRIEEVKSMKDASAYALKEVLNYSEAREDTSSHMRKTDVDWGLQFGKGKYAAKAKNEATKSTRELPGKRQALQGLFRTEEKKDFRKPKRSEVRR